MRIIEQVLWGWPVLAWVVLTGVYFSVQSGFFQLCHFGFWMKNAIFPQAGTGSALPKQAKSQLRKKAGISPFQALTAALGGSIGTGNIVGVAVAIGVGGAGAVLWMCISAFFGMMTLFAENVLAARYPARKGPLGYIETIRKYGKLLAAIYAAGCFLSSLAMGNMVQMNAAASALGQFGIPREISGMVFAAILFFVATHGLKAAVKITEKLVPLMAVLFFSASIVVIWVFRANLPAAVAEIIQGAFSWRAGLGGVSGAFLAAKTGISRGIFTNEAGLGSASFAYDEAEGLTPLQKGCMGIFQVFADTIVMCTVTGLCILVSRAPLYASGAEMSFFAFEAAMGSWGAQLISLCTALFAAATTVTWCCYGRASLFDLTGGRGATAFAVLYAFCAFLGSMVSLETAFRIGDICNGLMAIPNLLALFVLRGEIRQVIRSARAAPRRVRALRSG